jgi:hypothetical protein
LAEDYVKQRRSLSLRSLVARVAEPGEAMLNIRIVLDYFLARSALCQVAAREYEDGRCLARGA